MFTRACGTGRMRPPLKRDGARFDRPRWPDLAGERSPTTRSVIHLRAGHSPRFDLLGVLDSRLFVSLLHKPPSFGSIRFRTLKLASCSESRETLNAAAF